MIITLIAAVGENLELGKNNQLIWSIKKDLKFFKDTTSNKTVIMGRKTYESIGRPLPNRRNIVISTNTNLNIENVEVFNDIDKALENCKDEVFIIGGANIYKQMINRADKIYLTKICASDKDADAYFPSFDESKYKQTIIKKDEENSLKFIHILYEKL